MSTAITPFPDCTVNDTVVFGSSGYNKVLCVNQREGIFDNFRCPSPWAQLCSSQYASDTAHHYKTAYRLCSSGLEPLPQMQETLGSIPNTTKKTKLKTIPGSSVNLRAEILHYLDFHEAFNGTAESRTVSLLNPAQVYSLICMSSKQL